MTERENFGWRQLLGAVNLRDFARMVAAELGMIGVSLRLARESGSRMPTGPLILVGGVLLALLRFVLLVLVVAVFGASILVISAVRTVARLGRSGNEPS